MTFVALAILGPLFGATAILAVRRGAATLALLGCAAGLVGASVALVRAAGGAQLSATLPGLPGLPLRLVAEPLTAVLSGVVAVVGLLVVVYAVGYTEGEADKIRFFAGMSFFVAAMQALVLAGDWVLLLAAWELIGLSSYLLIGFHLERPAAASGATRAFLYTRSADLALYAGIFVLIAASGTSEISETLRVGGPAALLAGLLLLVAAAGKSAQTPLQGWLQDAMAGPTPVSALLHSATLVAAGAILLIRAYPLLPQEALLVAGLLGGVTAVVTGVIAVAQGEPHGEPHGEPQREPEGEPHGEPVGDLKRLLASSTSSQYGLMLLAVGAGAPAAAAAHLVTHAAMKSSLFLGAGVFQHARGTTGFSGLQGVGREHRRVFLGFAVAGLALAGIPPLAGFFSKEAIVAASFESPHAPLFAPLALAGTLLTGAYVARALRLLWRGETGGAPEGGPEGGPVAGAAWMGAGLAALAALAATLGVAIGPLGGLLGADLPGFGVSALLGLGSLAGLAAAVAGLLAGWLLPAGRMLGPLFAPARSGFRVAGGFDGLVARPALALARACSRLDGVVHAAVRAVGRGGLAVAYWTKLADERGIDGLIGALVRGTRNLGAHARGLQSGLVHRELLLAAAGGALAFVVLVIGL
ncbi:NADH-quinone oxidoreductase subunit L (plasmid) [Rubrobacter tropicus]|uniref:NADH-quinone oxidoreductase subunit L n=1 Tax=Rubrobacter tropicus TaxID=2653851 RepID=A0A6G8QFX8_9ACTN|nr:proton-conducting transporter membrane subunit [Rubrobacter tropicus]QIN85399.1 NADH-quinone oxidoreductase subunit L [Rubrobacter tropicus]